MQILNFGRVPGLTKEEQQQLSDLAAAYNYHQGRNATKDKYYEGHITLNDVNLGIALPQGLHNLEVGCSWGQKAVDVLAARSMFDGFVSTGGSLDSLAKLVADNRFVAQYAKACRDELKYGCVSASMISGSICWAALKAGSRWSGRNATTSIATPRVHSWSCTTRPLCRRCAARTGIFGWWAATGSCASCRPRNPTTSW